MKRSATLFLRFIILLFGVAVFVVMLWFPQTEGRAKNLDLLSIYLDPFITYIYLASIPFFVAVYQVLKFLGYFDKNKILCGKIPRYRHKDTYSKYFRIQCRTSIHCRHTSVRIDVFPLKYMLQLTRMDIWKYFIMYIHEFLSPLLDHSFACCLFNIHLNQI